MRVVVLALAALAFTAGPAQAKACNTPSYGDGYYLTLNVKKVSCAKGVSVAKAFTKCRHENGKKGRCKRKVQGFGCREKRGMSIPTEYSSKVTCTNGRKRVLFYYQQNT